MLCAALVLLCTAVDFLHVKTTCDPLLASLERDKALK